MVRNATAQYKRSVLSCRIKQADSTIQQEKSPESKQDKKMNTLFKLGMITALLVVIPVELQAMPHDQGIASQEVGEAAEQLKQMLEKMMADQAEESQLPLNQANTAQGYYDQAKESYWRPPYIQADADQDKESQLPLNQGYGYYDQAKESSWRPSIQADAVLENYETLAGELEDATSQVRGFQIRNCRLAGTILNLVLRPILARFNQHFGVDIDCADSRGCLHIRVDVPANVRKAEVNVCSNPTCVEVFAESPCPRGQRTRRIPIVLRFPGGFVLVRITVGTNCANVEVITALPTCPARG